MTATGRRPIPPLRSTPMYCVTIAKQRWLRLGVYTTAREAHRAAQDYCATHPWIDDAAVEVEQIYVSRQPR